MSFRGGEWLTAGGAPPTGIPVGEDATNTSQLIATFELVDSTHSSARCACFGALFSAATAFFPPQPHFGAIAADLDSRRGRQRLFFCGERAAVAVAGARGRQRVEEVEGVRHGGGICKDSIPTLRLQGFLGTAPRLSEFSAPS